MSIFVETVCGSVDSDQLGFTLPHEHIFNNVEVWFHQPRGERAFLENEKVNPAILNDLRRDPFSCRDNCKLDNFQDAIDDLKNFISHGGKTIFEVTPMNVGRNPQLLKQCSEITGINIIMGTGLYLDESISSELRNFNDYQLYDYLLKDVELGTDGIKPGIVGEIGVSANFTELEQRSLRCAARVAAAAKLPLTVHLPGWKRLGHLVLDSIDSESFPLDHVILCHMDPSFSDKDYQISLLQRGVILEYDMISMDFFYSDQDAQCPYVFQSSEAIAKLIQCGFAEQLLLSHDVFLKMMLTPNGGNGYVFIQKFFLDILKEKEIDSSIISKLTVENPKKLFSF